MADRRRPVESGRRRAGAARAGHVIGLVIVLPLMFETFQYVIDLYPLYALAKVLPLLLSPLALIALVRERLPVRYWFVVLGLYAGVLTPLLSALDFGTGAAAALATQVKLLPVSYYFTFYFLLARFRSSYDELVRALTVLALVTLVLFPLLWLTTPEATYYLGDQFTKVFLYDPQRGFRINLPLYFVEIFIFYRNRRYTTDRDWRDLAWVAGGLALLVAFYKERTVIAALCALVLWGRLAGLRLRLRLVLAAAAALAALGAATGLGYLGELAQSGSLTTRSGTVAIALAALDRHPLGWLFGLGALTRIGSQNFTALYGHNFFLADIGWLGMIYEYGLIGSALFGVILAQIVVYFRRHLAYTGDPLLLAFADQIGLQIVTSPILPLSYAPAEWAAAFALFVYFRRRIAAAIA